jgi:hypothetical protein
MDNDEKRKERHGPDDIKEVLSAVSTEVPGLIRSILSSVFSEEAGKSMGKAAAAYYKELKDGGLPEQVAVKMTADYMKTFTSLGDMLRSGSRHGHEEEFEKEIEKKVHDKIREKMRKDDEEDEEEEE